MSRKTRSELNVNRAVAQSLESWRQAGVSQAARPRGRKQNPVQIEGPAPEVAKPAVTSRAAESPANVPVAPAIVPRPASASPPSGPLNREARVEALAAINAEVVGCQRCPELCRTRNRTVFGVGNPESRLVFLGEAPGADEDQQGEPFVGRAGQLLTKIIEACTLRREDVYILNVLKCRPPGNRNPLPDEVENCREYLDRQLAVIRPEYICCLGAVAARRLLDTQLAIGKLRGKFYPYQGAQVLCTYHPSYLLRNPPAKKDVWEDMKILLRAMGIDWEK